MINSMIAGSIAMASLVIFLFFFRFWKSTNDRFFLFFAISFLLEAINRVLLGLSTLPNENAPLYYFIRFLAYFLILLAIIDKNNRQKNIKRKFINE